MSFVTDLNQIDASGSAVTWSNYDRITWQSNMLISDGIGFDKMAGNTIEYSRPIKRVTRERVTRGNEFLFQSNTGYTTLSATANDIELSDDDRLYYEESTHLITLDHNIDIAPVSSAPIDAGNFFTVRRRLYNQVWRPVLHRHRLERFRWHQVRCAWPVLQVLRL